MGTETLPEIRGYRRIQAYDCSRCGGFVRALYEQIPGVLPDKEIWRADMTEQRFAGGLALTSSEHAATSYYWATGPCGFRLLPQMVSGKTFINGIVERFSGGYGTPSARIVGFDAKRFLAGPWIVPATARVRDLAPLLLLAEPRMMRRIIANGGQVPAVGSTWSDVLQPEYAALTPLFLKQIGAVTEKVFS
jgi:hypothetical protein